jgi:hypothetical protein
MTPMRRIMREGLVVGLIAYVAVAAFYAAFDILAARGSLYTLNLLGEAVFRGLRDPAVLMLPVTRDPGAMAMYNALHLVLSVAIGFTATGIVSYAERHPARARLSGLVLLAGFVVTLLVVGFLSIPIRPVLPWWSIVVANSLSVLLAGLYVLRKHPGIWRRLLPFPV